MHDCGWVHRDIKPANIVFVDSVAKLCDFGIARPADDQKTAGAGTPGYAAPGQIATENIPNYRDDVYSIGVLLTELLTGRIPKPGKGSAELPLGIPEKLRAIVKKATAPEKEKRYANARALCDELNSALSRSTKVTSKGTAKA